MWRVTSNAAVSLQGGVLVCKGALLVRVALDAGCIRAGSKPRLFQFKPAVRIVAIAALHYSFENLVMERGVELRLHFTMTTQAELRLACLQQVQCREVRLLRVRS